MRKTIPIVAPQKILRSGTGNHRLSQARLQSTISPAARLPQTGRVKRICLLVGTSGPAGRVSLPRTTGPVIPARGKGQKLLDREEAF